MICDKVCNYVVSIKHHMIVHMDRQDSNIDNADLVYAYHVCKRGCKSGAELKNHLWVHSLALGGFKNMEYNSE